MLVLHTKTTQPLKVPFVREYRVPTDFMDCYQRRLYARQGALPAPEADRLIVESERAFLFNLTSLLPAPTDTETSESAAPAEDDMFE